MRPVHISSRRGSPITFSTLALFFILIIFFHSCKNENGRYPGFTQTASGLNYKLYSFGEGKQKPSKDEYIKLSLLYQTEKDSVFLNTQTQNPTGTVILSATDMIAAGQLGEGILNLNEDDSAAFVLSAGNLFPYFFKSEIPAFLTKTSMVKVSVKLKAILTKEKYAEEIKRYKEILETWEVEEQRRIQQYIKENKLQATQQPNGMYYVSLSEGTGPAVETGNTVEVNYRGCFLNGQQFDCTDKGPFEFKVGDEFQVIWGLQQGIKLMKRGGKAKFIIPSYLAFGENGSSTGIVPPNSTLIYEVELLNVK